MITKIIELQREFFLTKQTLDIRFRRAQLIKLYNSLNYHQEEIFQAFKDDYNKGKFDVISTELGLVNLEIKYMLKKLKRFAKRKRVRTDLMNFPSKGYIYQEPYGSVLIMSPWNYPLQLSLMPLIGAIATGNTIVLKPSDYSKNVACVIKKILSVFDEKYISVILGGVEQSQKLLEHKFDFIFFTGGDVVGRIVMEKASKFLTPVVLELGGKSPCIVDCDADVGLAAKRIAWGKFLNAGQTCIAPDYIYVHKDMKSKLIEKLKERILEYFYQNGILSDDYPHIINDIHAQRIKNLIDPKKIIFGGTFNGRSLEPTILDNVTKEDAVMAEEIFGPVLPILEFENLDDVIAEINSIDKPLAFYYFSKNKQKAEKVINSCSFGGGCINDTIMHICNMNMPFGGIGKSGMGSYHGKKSFEIFSHAKSVFVKGKLEVNVKYPPYTKWKLKLVKIITKTKTKQNRR